MSALDHTGDSFRWEPSYRSAIAPPRFNFGDPGSWMEWKKAYQCYHSLARLPNESDEFSILRLLNVMGLGAHNAFEQLTESDKKKYDQVMKGFDKFFAPWSNRAQHIVQFNRWMQGDNESNEHYIRGLVDLAAKCDFGKERENHIKHRLLTGMKDTALSAELIQQCLDDDLTMDTVTSQMIEKDKHETGSTAIDLTVALSGYGSAPQRNTMPAGYNMNPGPGNTMGGIAMAGQQRNMMMPLGNVTYQQQQQPMTVMTPQQMMGPPQQLMTGMNQPGLFANNPYMQQYFIDQMGYPRFN